MDLAIALYALNAGVLDDRTKSEVIEFRENISTFVTDKDPSLVEDVERHGELTQDVEKRMTALIDEYFAARVT
jgi:F0F1-type ATP synthase alpha subunit